MTFSILAKDSASNAIGGAAATGSLCVGGWVLRGVAGVGVSASQGKSPSTLWGDDILSRLKDGLEATDALQRVVSPDQGKAQRQLSVLNQNGDGAVFSGEENTADTAHRVFENGVAAGNMLSGGDVIDVMVESFLGETAPFAKRLLTALRAADNAGGDIRGLHSAALLVVSPDQPPLTLRIDESDDPLGALERLFHRATSGAYAEWSAHVPTLSDPYRH